MLKLKKYVRNKAHPEGSIAEGYLAEESAMFCSRYLEGIETVFNMPKRNEGSLAHDNAKYLFSTGGRGVGKVEMVKLDDLTWAQAHRYVLNHHEEVKTIHREIFASYVVEKKTKKIFRA